MGPHAQRAKLPRELLFPIRPRLHRRPRTRRGVLRRNVRAGGNRDRRRESVGWSSQELALSGFFQVRIRHPGRVRCGGRRPLRARRLRPARIVSPDQREGVRISLRCFASPRRDEAGSVQAEFDGAGVRCRALSAVLGHSDQHWTGHEHPHPGAADPPAEGVGIRGTAQPG